MRNNDLINKRVRLKKEFENEDFFEDKFPKSLDQVMRSRLISYIKEHRNSFTIVWADTTHIANGRDFTTITLAGVRGIFDYDWFELIEEETTTIVNIEGIVNIEDIQYILEN